MNEGHVVLLSVRCDDALWLAEVAFRDMHYTLRFKVDINDELREVSPTAFTLTREGYAIGRLVNLVRRGEAQTLPQPVEVPEDAPRLVSVHSDLWSPHVGPLDVWLDAVEDLGCGRFTARLRVDGAPDVYDVELRPGPLIVVLRSPGKPAFCSYEYDLQGLLLRMQNGERFRLPFQLRHRWPTPTAPAALRP